jgi:hypothetical protein
MGIGKAVQRVVFSGVVVVTGVEILGKNPGDNPHVENESKGADQPIGWEFFTVATTGLPLR